MKQKPTKLTRKNCFVKLYLLPVQAQAESPAMEYVGRFRAVPESHFKFKRLYSGDTYMRKTFAYLQQQVPLKEGVRFLMVAEFNKSEVFLT